MRGSSLRFSETSNNLDGLFLDFRFSRSCCENLGRHVGIVDSERNLSFASSKGMFPKKQEIQEL